MKCVIVISLCLVSGIKSALFNMEEGEKCNTTSSEEWICQTLINCPQIGDFRSSRPDICSFKGKDPIICCPPNKSVQSETFNINNPKSTTEKESSSNVGSADRTPSKPPEYPSSTLSGSPPLAIMKCIQYEVGLCQNLIKKDFGKTRLIRDVSASSVKLNFRQDAVGGQFAALDKFSFMVAIGFGEESNITFECGGTLISETWVLSAAHCAQSNSGKAKWVGLRAVMVEPELIGLSMPINQIVIHPSYKAPAVYHDIALFRLKTYIGFNIYVQPMCLHSLKAIPRHATATGWGTSFFGGEKNRLNLLYDDMKSVDPEYCKNVYNKSSLLPHGYDNEIMFCAIEERKDSCIGGGPLFYNSSICLHIQHGIYSFKHKCGSHPGLYTRISYYVPWIESIIWPNVKPDLF